MKQKVHLIIKLQVSYQCCAEEGGQGGNCVDESRATGGVRKLIQHVDFEAEQRVYERSGENWELGLKNREWKLSAFLGSCPLTMSRALSFYTRITDYTIFIFIFINLYGFYTLISGLDFIFFGWIDV